MGSSRKITFHRTAERKGLGFYVGVIVFGAVVLAGLSFAPYIFMVFGWGSLLLVPAVAYPLFSTMPRRKTMAFVVSASIVGAFISSCCFAPRRSLVENVTWIFIALASILLIQVVGRANLSDRLNAIVATTPLASASHLGILWLLVRRDVATTSYILRVTVVMACGALILLAPIFRKTSFLAVTSTTAIGFVVLGYNYRQMEPLAALCIGFCCGIILATGSRYVTLITKKKPLERSEGALIRKQRSIRVQIVAGFAATVAIGFMSYFFGAVFIL